MYLFAYKMHCARFVLEHIQQVTGGISIGLNLRRDQARFLCHKLTELFFSTGVILIEAKKNSSDLKSVRYGLFWRQLHLFNANQNPVSVLVQVLFLVVSPKNKFLSYQFPLSAPDFSQVHLLINSKVVLVKKYFGATSKHKYRHNSTSSIWECIERTSVHATQFICDRTN